MPTKKQLANLKPFRKGQKSANPEGARLHNPEIKLIKRLTEKELAEVATVILGMEVGKIKAKMKDPKTTVLQGMVLGLALRAITKGDKGPFEALMDRILGKVKESVNISGSVGTNISGTAKVIIALPPNNREPNK